MLVLIDETGLPWARDYYRQFPWEPSRKPEDDIDLSKATVTLLKKPTLMDVMKAMDKAATSGEKELMLVAHGNERGLVMHIAPGIALSAEVSTLKWLPIAGELFELIDTASSLPQNRAQLNAWARIAALFETQGDESAIDAPTERIAREQLADANGDVAQACGLIQKRITDLTLKSAGGLVRNLKTTERALRDASALAVKVRDARYKRIELRACNIGDGPGIAALRAFFAVERLTAPKVHTFYVQVIPREETADKLAALAKSPDARRRLFSSDPFMVPLEKSRLPPWVRPHFEPENQALVPGSLNFMLRVTRIEVPLYRSWSARLNEKAVADWVPRYVHPLARYSGRGNLWVGGLDGPTPKGEPYTLPQDSNYRTLIALATATGVER